LEPGSDGVDLLVGEAADGRPAHAALPAWAWICAVLGGEVASPERDRQLAGIAAERKIRERRPRPQFPHRDYLEMADSLATELGVLPEPGSPVVPAQYWLHGPGAAPEVGRSEIEAARRRMEAT